MKIIHACDTDRIQELPVNNPASYAFMILDREEAGNVKALRLKGLEEIVPDTLSDEERRLCEKEYIRHISSMGTGIPPINWWANPASEKNEHLSTLYSSVSLYFALVKTLEKLRGSDRVILLVCSYAIYEQLHAYAGQKGIVLETLEKQIVTKTRQLLRNLAGISGFILRALIKKIYTHLKTEERVKERLKNKSGCYIFRSWLDSRYLGSGPEYRDSFFGVLPEFISGRGRDILILANINDNYFRIIDKISSEKGEQIVPEEYFLRYRDLLGSLRHLGSQQKHSGAFNLNGLDLSILYHRAVEQGFLCAEYIRNIHRYYIAKQVTAELDFGTYIQPYENYAWEKTSLLGLRNGGARGRLLGFQHAYISRNSFKYFPGKEEKDSIPLPDRIITMGSVTRDIMKKYGHYDENIFSVGCALRQDYLDGITPFKRRRLGKVVVPLTMVTSESVSVLTFLYHSGLAGSETTFAIRCHPAAPFDTFRNELGFDLPDNFRISSEVSVKNELSGSDMVLYTWTTVAIEALKMGLPVIYLDILGPVYVDPLFECTSLKRSVSKPEDLPHVVDDLYNMDDDAYYEEQRASQDYLAEYFVPVNEAQMLPFLEPEH